MRWHHWAFALAACAAIAGAMSPASAITTTLRVNKRVIPWNDPGRFNLSIDTVNHALSVGNGGTTGPVQVTPGVHIVREGAANAATNLCNYVITYSGDCSSNGHITMSVGQQKSCLIVNTRRTWTPKANMPTAREYFAAGVIGTKIYAIGGQGGWYSTLEVYNTLTNTWVTKTPMPTARTGVAAGVVNGILYVVGGNRPTGAGSSQVLDLVEAYNPVTDSWTTKASMPTPRDGLAVAVVGGKLYAIGGNASVFGTAVNKVEAYNPVANTWATKAPMLSTRAWHGAGVISNKIYVVGGRAGANSAPQIATMHMYNPATNSWSVRPPMPTARYGIGVAVANGKLYAIGHWGTNQVFNPANGGTWFTGVPMPTARWFLSVAVVSSVIYAIGGYHVGVGDTRKVEAFTPC